MSVEEKLARLEEGLADVKAELASQASETGESGAVDLNSNPEVQTAAVNLAKAIAKARGIDMPMALAPGSVGELPVMELPEEFQKYGGIGIGVMVAPPTEAAQSAAVPPGAERV